MCNITLKEISKIILSSNKIAISCHTSPDGDAIGSTLGLLNALKVLGKDAYVVSREVIPDNLSFLPLGNEFNNEVTSVIDGTDLVIILDCGNVDRINANLEEYKGVILNIDHHISNEMFGKFNYIETKAAATCELVYLLCKELGIVFEKDNESSIKIGTCIYTGILTDTGSFRHSNVTKRTHIIAGELIEIGVKNNEIHSELFENRLYSKIKLIGQSLSKLELLYNNKISCIVLTKELLKSLGCENVDTSDIISMALSIKDVEVATVIKEADDGVKASLRSKRDIDVRRVAEALGGGGHVKAAGLKIKEKSLGEAKEMILNQIVKEL